MIVAYDADVLYDLKNGIHQIGRVEHLITQKELDPKGKIIVWSNQGIAYVRRILARARVPEIVEVMDRTAYLVGLGEEHIDLEYARLDTGTKATITVRLETDEARKALVESQTRVP